MAEGIPVTCVPVSKQRMDSVMWYSVVIAVTIALAISAFVLSLHSAFPHKDAAHKAEILLVHDQIRDLRDDMRSLTSEIGKLRNVLHKVAWSRQSNDPSVRD